MSGDTVGPGTGSGPDNPEAPSNAGGGGELQAGGLADGGADLGEGGEGFGVTAEVGGAAPQTLTREDLEQGATTGVPTQDDVDPTV